MCLALKIDTQLQAATLPDRCPKMKLCGAYVKATAANWFVFHMDMMVFYGAHFKNIVLECNAF